MRIVGVYASLVVAATTVATLTACLGFAGCTDEQARAFTEIDHYGDRPLEPEQHTSGLCYASFSDDDPVQDVVDHYRAVLPRGGWTIHDDAGTSLAAHTSDFQVTIDSVAGSYEVRLGPAQPLREPDN